LELGLVYVGAGFAGLYALSAIFKTLLRAEKVNFWDVLLVFAAVLIALSALIMSASDGLPDARTDFTALLVGGVLAAFGLLLTLIEAFRPQRLKQSRGILALGAGLMLTLASVVVPLASAYISVPPLSASPSVAVATTPSADIDPTAEARQRFDALFKDLFAVVGQESGLDVNGILIALDNGKTIAQIVEENNGSVDRVVSRVTQLLIDQIQASAARGEITRLEAAGGIMFAESGVRLAISNDIRTLQQLGRERGGVTDETATPIGEDGSFFAFLTVTPSESIVAVAVVASVTPSPTITQTPFPTITPPPNREPTATPTPSLTRVRISTATPTATATLGTPCLVEALYNVNLRQLPDLNAALVTTVPFQTVIEAYARSEDSQWFYVTFGESQGWLKAEFVRAGAQCAALPVRDER